MDKIDTIVYKDYFINIYYDNDPDSPRNWDNLGTMVCWHNRCNLGDKKDNANISVKGFLAELAVYTDDNEDWYYKKIDELLHKARKRAAILPLYLYDHSGITMSTRPFGCQWDSGQVGYIYATHEAIKNELGLKRLSKKAKQKATSILINEVEVYDQYLTGDVYGYIITDKDDNEIEEGSCWGFFGYDHKESGLLSYAQSIIDYEIEHPKVNNGAA